VLDLVSSVRQEIEIGWEERLRNDQAHFVSRIGRKLNRATALVTHGSLGLVESTTQTASRLIQPFLRARDRDRQTDRQTAVLRL